mmetsp:Transcript_46760/g.117784  ORF Transcript_46760/g.117784 Transcript_46760/m.117784 type:complete len:389 (+) Transcript_46760:161-1327(+)
MPSVLSRPAQVTWDQASPSASCSSSSSGGSSWTDAIAMGLYGMCLRAAKPFEELTEDLCEAAAAFVPGHADVGHSTLLPSADSTPRSDVPGSEAHSPHDMGTATLAVLDRAIAPLLELGEDAGPGGALAMLAALGPAASITTGGKALLLLCGVSTQTKGVYALMSLAMAGGAYSMWNRHPEEVDRTLQRRSAAALLCSSAMHLALALGFGIPPSLPIHVTNPEVMVRFLPDIVIIPLIIMNIGYLAGKKADHMLPTVGFGLLSTVSLATAAAATSSEAVPLLVTGITCMLKAAFDINRALPVQAGSLSAVNKLRTQISADLMVFTWVGYPLVEALGMMNCITLSSELHAFVVLDLIGKLGVCHIVLRSQEAFLNAQRALATEVRLPPS